MSGNYNLKQKITKSSVVRQGATGEWKRGFPRGKVMGEVVGAGRMEVLQGTVGQKGKVMEHVGMFVSRGRRWEDASRQLGNGEWFKDCSGKQASIWLKHKSY